jgi:hypothetical protein
MAIRPYALNRKDHFTMFRPHLFFSRHLAILILALAIAAGAYALAAANNVGESGAGEGAANITPYTVDSNSIRYTLDDQINPIDIKKVQFAINIQAGSSAGPPSEVYARVDNGVWVNCANVGGVDWECPFSPPYPQVSLSPLTTLEVVAAQ